MSKQLIFNYFDAAFVLGYADRADKGYNSVKMLVRRGRLGSFNPPGERRRVIHRSELIRYLHSIGKDETALESASPTVAA